MADQYVLLRPNSLWGRSSNANNVYPGGTIPTGVECANDSDSTYVICVVLDTNEYIVYNMSEFAFPAGAQITLLYPLVRINNAGGASLLPGQASPAGVTFQAHCQCAGEDSPVTAQTFNGNTWTTIGLATKATKNNGQPFTVDDVNNTLLGIFWDLTDNRASAAPAGTGYKYCTITEFYVYVYYNVRPTTVVAAPVEGGSITTTSSPTVTWTYSDPESDAKTFHRVKIFSDAQYNAAGFNPETSAPVVDSGDVSGTGLSFSYSTILANNTTHRAYVKTKDSLQWSLWDYNQFTINVTPPGTAGSTQPGAPSLIVTEESAFARVKLEIDEGTSPTVDWFTIERSEDGGITWAKVRDANPILYPNLLSQNQSEFELAVAGWTATNQVAGFPSRDIGQIYAGAYALNLKSLAAGDVDAYGPLIPSIPGATYRFRSWVRSAVTARTFTPYIRWHADLNTWSATSAGVGVVSVTNGWREIVVEAVCPAGMFYMSGMARVLATVINELHYLDTASIKKKILPITVYDNEVPRRLAAGMLKYRAQGVRYSAPQESPMVTTTSTPYTANIAGALATDNKNWLKSPTNPLLNIPVRFGFGSGEKWELSAEEEQAIFTPKGRGVAVAFGSNTEAEDFDLPLAFITEAEYQAFETLRKRREPLLLQTRYGESASSAIQLWVQLKNRTSTMVNLPGQGLTARKVTVHATVIGKPGDTTVVNALTTVYALEGNWVPLALANGWTQVGTVVPAVMKDSLGIVHYRGQITNATANVAAFFAPVGYRPYTGIQYFNWDATTDGFVVYLSGQVNPYGSGLQDLKWIKYLAGA